MVLSTRTVDHHVPAVRQKVAITSRREAAGAAARVGVV
jgi:DNA-binding CsgD family transcriptional regulator